MRNRRQEVPLEVKQAALDLIRRDAALDDEVYTPPGALGHYFPPSGGGPEGAGDREPRVPKNPSAAGAIALQEVQL